MTKFKATVWSFYRKNRREMAWRNTTDPYHILVSEVMLQQTQVARVAVKYPEFLAAFPDVATLAQASINNVYKVWQGMGYNRRALFLKRAAEMVMNNYGGVFPDDPQLLVKLPGIGVATAGSIAAFAWNKPTVFIETNIRRVFIHHFFAGQEDVSDNIIHPLVEEAVDREHPREWYYALMDYGTYLSKTEGNANRRSAHYTKQSKFEGSNRQVRSAVLRALSAKSQSATSLLKILSFDKEKIEANLEALQKEGFLVKKRRMYEIAS
jgi:A/G-specific adenine glycosylase